LCPANDNESKFHHGDRKLHRDEKQHARNSLVLNTKINQRLFGHKSFGLAAAIVVVVVDSTSFFCCCCVLDNKQKLQWLSIDSTDKLNSAWQLNLSINKQTLALRKFCAENSMLRRPKKAKSFT